jgi:hypothetical protein
MTQPTSNGVDRYTGNGATSTFSYTFKILDDDDIEVVVINTSTRARTVLTKTTHYTVDAATVGDSAGGSVTLISPYANLSSTYKIVLFLKPDLNNQSAFSNGNVNGPALEAALDVMSQRIIEVAEDVSRSVKLPSDEAGTITLTNLGAATDRANKYLTFDSSGNVSASTTVEEGSIAVTATGEALMEAASVSAALTVLGVAAFPQTLLDDTTAAAFMTTLGITATGQDIIDSANVAAARTAIGLDGASGAIGSLDIADAATAQIFQARLTLTTAEPVAMLVNDVTTVYLTPYKGNKVAVYTGSRWKIMPLTEISIAVPATTDTNYDVFLYDNSGTLTLENVAWTNNTTRATALAIQDGVYVKNGTTTKRYVGTFRTSSVSGNTRNLQGYRLIWNYYNRVRMNFHVEDTNNTWEYTTATWRQANAATTNKIELVQGVVEDVISVWALGHSSNSSASVLRGIAIGLDTTSGASSAGHFSVIGAAADHIIPHHAEYTYPITNPGYHYFSWNEWSAATGTTTWYGDNGAAAQILRSGMYGSGLF